MRRRLDTVDPVAAAVCHGCGDPINIRYAWRSQKWAHGVFGVHFLYCTQGCRTTFEKVTR